MKRIINLLAGTLFGGIESLLMSHGASTAPTQAGDSLMPAGLAVPIWLNFAGPQWSA